MLFIKYEQLVKKKIFKKNIFFDSSEITNFYQIIDNKRGFTMCKPVSSLYKEQTIIVPISNTLTNSDCLFQNLLHRYGKDNVYITREKIHRTL